MQMREHDHADRLQTMSKWALAIAQGVILAFLGWFARQQLDMHDQLNQLTWEMAQVRSNAATVVDNKALINQLGFRMTDLEKRQAKDDDFRERYQEALMRQRPGH